MSNFKSDKDPLREILKKNRSRDRYNFPSFNGVGYGPMTMSKRLSLVYHNHFQLEQY